MKEFIEKAFGIKDSELEGWEYKIPEGYTASIENGKIVVKKGESDDEKIRKYLLKLAEMCPDDSIAFMGEVKKEDIIAWLEKQGEQKPVPKFKVGDTMRTLQEATNGYTDGMPVVVSIDKEYYHCTNELIAIKDQDDYEFPPINVKQNLTDKVEPKFKVDDFIKHNKANIICKVIAVNSNGYSYYVENIGIGGSRIELSNAEQNFHLWTIQDAKDGDVLCDGIDTVIYKKNIYDMVRRSMFVHCGINNRTGYWFEVGGISPIDYLPATKEQRDLLFQKMKEAGYVWDADKKELKKIHVIDEGKAEMDYCFTKMMNGEKVSSVWSEEDEKIIEDIIFSINEESIIDGLRIRGISYSLEGVKTKIKIFKDWLKSLKERMKGE